jgi:multimeric flavodoxin WrbA
MKYSKLKALYVNASLKKNSTESHTGLLLEASASIMEKQGVSIDRLHILDHDIPPGIYPDMTDYGYERDEWPDVWMRIRAADILIVGTPIWLGEESSLCRLLIERLYAMSGELNSKGQSIYYGKVGGSVITGNEDGIKHCAMSIGYALNHLGFTLPPQADCGWIGEAGPGLSYGDRQDDGSHAGFDNDFTQRNTTIMTWNCMHLALLLAGSDGIPSEGNDRNAWKNGARFGFKNPSGSVQ